MPRNGSGVASAVPGFGSYTASTTILSALMNAGLVDVINMLNSPWPLSVGLGAAGQIGSWDAITAKGTDIASASTIVLTTATGPRIDITGTTAITAVTLANGSVRIARATGAVKFTASSTLLVNGSAKDSYTTKSGDLLMFTAEGGVVSVYVIARGMAATLRTRTNRFWNPACEVSQQNGTTLGTANGYFACDSLAMYFTAATAAMSVQQIAGPTLNGSAHQIEYKCTTAKAVLGASDFVTLTGKIEGLDVADLQWGTASAIPATYSFQFKGPAGTYHVHFQNRSGNRHIAIPFTPTAANTEERITVIVPGDTSGTWTVDNDTLLTADVVLAAGSTLTGGSASTWSGSTFYAATTQFNILSLNTNVVRVGDFTFSPDPDATGVAPAWVPVGIGDSTRDCQRYYWKSFAQGVVPVQNSGTSVGALEGTQFVGAGVSTIILVHIRLPVTMRGTPSVTLFNPQAANAQIRDQNTLTDWTSCGVDVVGDGAFSVFGTTPAGSSIGHIGYVHATAVVRLS